MLRKWIVLQKISVLKENYLSWILIEMKKQIKCRSFYSRTLSLEANVKLALFGLSELCIRKSQVFGFVLPTSFGLTKWANKAYWVPFLVKS